MADYTMTPEMSACIQEIAGSTEQAAGRAAFGAAGTAELAAVDAKADANAADITWFEDFVPELSGSHGALELHAKVSGNVATPTVDTKLKLSSGALVLPDIGLNIDSLAVQANGATRGVNVDAPVASADHE